MKMKYSFHLLVVEGHYKERQVKEAAEGVVTASKEAPVQDQGKVHFQALENFL
jgi:hypothetical protein